MAEVCQNVETMLFIDYWSGMFCFCIPRWRFDYALVSISENTQGNQQRQRPYSVDAFARMCVNCAESKTIESIFARVCSSVRDYLRSHGGTCCCPLKAHISEWDEILPGMPPSEQKTTEEKTMAVPLANL